MPSTARPKGDAKTTYFFQNDLFSILFCNRRLFIVFFIGETLSNPVIKGKGEVPSTVVHFSNYVFKVIYPNRFPSFVRGCFYSRLLNVDGDSNRYEWQCNRPYFF